MGCTPFLRQWRAFALKVCEEAVSHILQVEIAMPDQPPPSASNRFKAEMPQIPGVSSGPERLSGPGGGPWFIVGGLAAVLIAVFVGGRLLSKSRRAQTAPPPAAQIDVPVEAPSALPDLPVPVATEANPVIARVGELAK